MTVWCSLAGRSQGAVAEDEESEGRHRSSGSAHGGERAEGRTAAERNRGAATPQGTGTVKGGFR